MSIKFASIKHLFHKHLLREIEFAVPLIVLLGIALFLGWILFDQYDQLLASQQEAKDLTGRLAQTNAQYIALKNQDQYKINQDLKQNIKDIQTTYKDSIAAYQDILDLQSEKQKTDGLTSEYAQTVKYLEDLNYASASATLKSLQAQVQKAKDAYAASQVPAAAPVNATTSNTPPKNGFNQQYVSTGNGTFLVDIIAADLNSTRVIVDTASDSDCSNNCPVLSLSDYVSRSGAWAGINGTYFCPADYPSCAGKTNSFDTLLMNKKKTYFNSANNVYSIVPAVIINGTNVRFVAHSEDWGRDTSVDAVIAMQPLLILDSQNVYGGSGDPKLLSKGPRGFIANIGSTVYIGDVLNATMQDSASVLKALGMQNAINLDEGGSTALWYGGYKLGPGRGIPNAVLFVNK